MIDPAFKKAVVSSRDYSESMCKSLYNILKSQHFYYNILKSSAYNDTIIELHTFIDKVSINNIDSLKIFEINKAFDKNNFFIFKRRSVEASSGTITYSTVIDCNYLEGVSIQRLKMTGAVLELRYFDKKSESILKDQITYTTIEQLDDQLSELLGFLLKKNRYDIILKLGNVFNG